MTKKGVMKRSEEDILRMGLFIIFNALIFHEVISNHNSSVQSLKRAPSTNCIPFLDEEWTKLEKDYKEVFQLAHEILLSFPGSPTTDALLQKLEETVLEVVSSGSLLRHDLMGRIYHKLLLRTTAKYYATYYTSIPAAWLLAGLSIKTPNPELKWSFDSVGNIKFLRVLDPACGSGTLLSAIYSAIKDKYMFEKNEDINLDKLHEALVGEVLHGWDVLDYAAHLTLTTLALRSYQSSPSNSHIYTLQIGFDGENCYLGSLQYFNRQLPFLGKGFSFGPERKSLSEGRETQIELPEGCDVIIMNPPFSRSAGNVNIKFGYEEKDVRGKLNTELKKLEKKLRVKGIGQAGLGAYFILLADKLLKKGGRLAVVLPRAILSGVSWSEIREKLLKEYEIEYLISNHDPGNRDEEIEPWNFSEGTKLGEVLILARKTDKPPIDKFTTIVNLWHKPKNETEALVISHQSMKARMENDNLNFFGSGSYKALNLGKEVGTIYNLKQEALKKINFLYPCLFANPSLNKLLMELYSFSFLRVSLKDIVSSLGIDRKQLETSFKLVHHQTPYLGLWGLPGELQTIELNRKDYILPRKGSDLYAKKSRLLVAERIWLNTQKIIALYSPDPIVATMFWEIQLEDKEDAKIFSLWFNSTFGFLIILSLSISNGGEWFNLKKGQLKEVLVPDVSQMSGEARSLCLKTFNDLKTKPLGTLREEFEFASKGEGIKRQIDDTIKQALGIQIDLQPYYQMLAVEPVVTLKRFKELDKRSPKPAE